jgi:hypothetical protein
MFAGGWGVGGGVVVSSTSKNKNNFTPALVSNIHIDILSKMRKKLHASKSHVIL